MRVTKAGQHEPAIRVDAPRIFAGQGQNFIISADRDNPILLDRHGLRPGQRVVLRVDAGVVENQGGGASNTLHRISAFLKQDARCRHRMIANSRVDQLSLILSVANLMPNA